MFIRVWAETKHNEKLLYGHANSFEEAIRWSKALIEAGYKKAWIEVQEE